MSSNDPATRHRFTEIDVERINVLGPDGKPRLVIANEDRVPPPVVNGQTFTRKGDARFAGMLFYNLEGDECGALVYNGSGEPGRHSAGAALKFDQYRESETVELVYADEAGNRTCGLQIVDRVQQPGIQGQRWRVWVGRHEGEVSVALADSSGRARIRMCVDADDTPRLEFLDGDGHVVYSLPPPQGAGG